MSFRCTASIAGSADILRKALASASGFFVISADPASAIYSRLREMAKRIRLAKRKPIAAISKAINMKMKIPPLPLLSVSYTHLTLPTSDLV